MAKYRKPLDGDFFSLNIDSSGRLLFMAWTWELWWKTTKEVQEFYVCGIFVGIVGCWSCSLVTSGKLLLSGWLLVPVTLLPLPVLVCSAQTDVVSMNYWIMLN